MSNIKEGLKILEYAISKKVSIKKACEKFGRAEDFLRKLRARIKFLESQGRISKQDSDKFLSLYKNHLESKTSKKSEEIIEKPVDYDLLTDEEKTEVQYDAYKDDKYDERSSGDIIRSDSNFFVDGDGRKIYKISGYRYKILIRDEEPLEGELTREEMDMVYRLYSNMDGAGLTLRTVSRHFTNITFRDFKRILRAFNITKQSIPVAPHVLEENDEDSVLKIIFRNKENNILKKLESDRSKYTESILFETQKELLSLKEKYRNINEVINTIDLSDIKPFNIDKKVTNEEKAIVVYLSDQHVGAHTEEDSIYTNRYDEKEFGSRMKKTLEMIHEQYSIHGHFDKIFICNLGDCLDGFNGETTRGGHKLPQNMNNKTQFNVYVNSMISFFESLHKLNISNSVEYHCVSDDNHSGDMGYMANRALEVYLNLRFPEMKINIFEKFIETFKYGIHTFILSHGKDKKDMHKGFPLILEPKTEMYFNEYIDTMRIHSECIHIVLGDLHQSLTQFSKRFRWKRVLSMYGASKWIHTNFGKSRAGLDFDVVKKESEDITEGRIWFN